MDAGTCISGKDDGSCHYGQWKNVELGEYVLCAYKSFGTMIQINTADGIYLISYESAETTTGLYESIVETLQAEGYSFQTVLP